PRRWSMRVSIVVAIVVFGGGIYAPPALGGSPEKGAYTPQAGKMSHCPNVVPGAETQIANTPRGVDMTITAASSAAASDIRARARHMEAIARAGAPHATP